MPPDGTVLDFFLAFTNASALRFKAPWEVSGEDFLAAFDCDGTRGCMPLPNSMMRDTYDRSLPEPVGPVSGKHPSRSALIAVSLMFRPLYRFLKDIKANVMFSSVTGPSLFMSIGIPTSADRCKG